MAHLMEIEAVKTYKTRENAIKAVEKKIPADKLPQLNYFIHTTPEGRFFAVFVGEQALQNMVHFHFNVIM